MGLFWRGVQTTKELRNTIFNLLEGLGRTTLIGLIVRGEKNRPPCVSRVLRLTMPASEIVDSILDCVRPAGMTLAVLIRPFVVGWREQLDE